MSLNNSAGHASKSNSPYHSRIAFWFSGKSRTMLAALALVVAVHAIGPTSVYARQVHLGCINATGETVKFYWTINPSVGVYHIIDDVQPASDGTANDQIYDVDIPDNISRLYLWAGGKLEAFFPGGDVFVIEVP